MGNKTIKIENLTLREIQTICDYSNNKCEMCPLNMVKCGSIKDLKKYNDEEIALNFKEDKIEWFNEKTNLVTKIKKIFPLSEFKYYYSKKYKYSCLDVDLIVEYDWLDYSVIIGRLHINYSFVDDKSDHYAEYIFRDSTGLLYKIAEKAFIEKETNFIENNIVILKSTYKNFIELKEILSQHNLKLCFEDDGNY